MTTLNESILVIDDNTDMLALQRVVLEMEGFEVFTALGAFEAFKLLSEIDAPDLILLDMQMDGMNGLEFLKTLEVTKPKIISDVPIVFLTGMDSVPESKAAGFIRKATDLDRFLEDIHRFIDSGHRTPYKH
jgi:CheY-like chemotaxis protein